MGKVSFLMSDDLLSGMFGLPDNVRVIAITRSNGYRTDVWEVIVEGDRFPPTEYPTLIKPIVNNVGQGGTPVIHVEWDWGIENNARR